MATQNWVNIGSDNGLLPDGNKPSHEPMLTERSSDIHLREILQEINQSPIIKISRKITFSNFIQISLGPMS